MKDQRLPGPYHSIISADGSEIPYYIIPFDKRGQCEGPETRCHLVESVKEGTYSDIFLFSHGWNNDWTVATHRYNEFITGFMDMRRKYNLPVPANYNPLLVGIFWPSTALVFGEEETGPHIAAGAEAKNIMIDEKSYEIRQLAEELPAEQAQRFYDLTQKRNLTQEEARELAHIAQVFYHEKDEELQIQASSSEEDIVNLWSAAVPETETDLEDFGIVGDTSAGPKAAGLNDLAKGLDPRNIVRMMSVYQMKDRAGVVGANGVSTLLQDLLAACGARLHLIGHSYGAKVMLSAITFGQPLQRKVESMLLLQPAVSHLCFAKKVPGTNSPGGYRPALQRVNRPILTTFSANDFPLTKTFHLAVRRRDDLGEARIAGSGEPPSKYAALGGFGPRHGGEQLVDIHDAGSPYTFVEGGQVIGLRATRTIKGHGDICNESIWWALYCLVFE